MAPILSLPTFADAAKGISVSPLTSNISFGHSMLKYFSFEPGYINLNNGRCLLRPSPILRLILVREQVHLGRSPSRWLSFVCSMLLGLKRIRIISSTRVCGAPHSRARSCCQIDRSRHGRMRLHLKRFREHVVGVSKLSKLIENLRYNRLGRIAPGCCFALEKDDPTLSEEGVCSIIDAAHSIGQEIDIDLASAQPDFWVSSALVTSWDYPSSKESPPAVYDTGFVLQHECKYISSYLLAGACVDRAALLFSGPGAIDFSPYLSVCAAMDFREKIGGEQAINAYCHKLALEGGRRLASVLGGCALDESPSTELTLNMVCMTRFPCFLYVAAKELSSTGECTTSASSDTIERTPGKDRKLSGTRAVAYIQRILCTLLPRWFVGSPLLRWTAGTTTRRLAVQRSE
ncbi:PLP-dependent transferase [Salix suchowensis]|nr:PLP-dependent transferase [Salix suchowensis]